MTVTEADYLLGNSENPILTVAQNALADLQSIFFDQANTTLDGETIANADIAYLTTQSTILQTLGELEAEILFPEAKGVFASLAPPSTPSSGSTKNL